MRKPAIISAPKKKEFEAYYEKYVKLAEESHDGILALEESKNTLVAAVEKIGEAKAMHRYQIDKWTPKELLQHIIDSELIFLYRALRIARHDDQALPGFDQDLYVRKSKANDHSLFEILEQFKLLRLLTILTFTNFPQDSIERTGIANGNKVSVRALAYIIAGHSLHHARILEDRYL